MAHQTTKSWRTVRAQRPLNEREVARYRRSFDAEAGVGSGAEDDRGGEAGAQSGAEDDRGGEDNHRIRPLDPSDHLPSAEPPDVPRPL